VCWWVLVHVALTHCPFLGFRPSGSNFITPGALLEPLVMGRLAGEQEPNEKNVLSMHHPSMIVHLWVLVHCGPQLPVAPGRRFAFAP